MACDELWPPQGTSTPSHPHACAPKCTHKQTITLEFDTIFINIYGCFIWMACCLHLMGYGCHDWVHVHFHCKHLELTPKEGFIRQFGCNDESKILFAFVKLWSFHRGKIAEIKRAYECPLFPIRPGVHYIATKDLLLLFWILSTPPTPLESLCWQKWKGSISDIQKYFLNPLLTVLASIKHTDA